MERTGKQMTRVQAAGCRKTTKEQKARRKKASRAACLRCAEVEESRELLAQAQAQAEQVCGWVSCQLCLSPAAQSAERMSEFYAKRAEARGRAPPRHLTRQARPRVHDRQRPSRGGLASA